MKIAKKIITLLALIMTVVILPEAVMAAKENHVITSIEAIYPDGKTSIIATSDPLDLKFNLSLSSMSAGDSIFIENNEYNHINLSQSSFVVSGYKVEVTSDGITITALEDTEPTDLSLTVPMLYNTNVVGTETKELHFKLENVDYNTNISVTEFKSFVAKDEIVKKSNWGEKNGELYWVVYFNFNEIELLGTPDIPLIIKDTLGPGQELIPSSIEAYNVDNPINADGSRNTHYDAYNYDVSYELQHSSIINGNGFEYTNTDFHGFPKTDGSFEPSTSAYVIIYKSKITNPEQLEATNEINVSATTPGNGENIVLDQQSNSQVGMLPGGGGEVYKGEVAFIKVDSEDKSQLDGAHFLLENKDKSFSKEIITTKNEISRVSNLKYGDYTLTEIKPPNGYENSHKIIQFTVDENTPMIDLGMIENTKTPVIPETPVIENPELPETPIIETPTDSKNPKESNPNNKSKETLPQTGETTAAWLSGLGVALLIVAGYVVYKRRK